MKFRRITALILMMIASVFILAHAVLPHSHHDGVVCFSLSELAHQKHCSDMHDDLNACCDGQNGKAHHHHATSEDCDLKEIVLRQSNDSHEDILPCQNCLSLMYVIYPLNELFLEIPEFGQYLQEKPYLENYIPPFVGSVRSLRAPPVSYFLG